MLCALKIAFAMESLPGAEVDVVGIDGYSTRSIEQCQELKVTGGVA